RAARKRVVPAAMSPLCAARAALRVYTAGAAVVLTQLLRRCRGGYSEPAMEPKGLEGAADLKLVAHPRAKSKVWKYFGFDTNAEGCILQWKKIYCRICMAQIAYSGNTSNLSYHLEKNHPEEFCELVKSNTEQMREAFASAFSRLKPDAGAAAGTSAQPGAAPDALGAAPAAKAHGHEAKRQQELTAAVLALICDGLYPASIVDEPTFRALLKTAEPRYDLPSRKFFCAKALPEKYGAVRELVLKELADAPWCGVSADLWASPNQNRAYVTLAAHFLGAGSPPGLALGSRCLKTFEVPEENAAETITRVLYEAFIEWGIGAKVFGATTDSGKDIAKACSLLDVPVHMPCLGQTFDAGIQRATLAMLRRLREQQFAIAGVLLEDTNNHHLMLEAAEWATIEGLVDLLQPFKEVGDMLSASRRPAISMVKPLLHMLLNTTLTVKETDAKEISMAKEVIAKELARTYQDAPEIDMFLNVATFLDPRYKRLPFLSAFERQQVEDRVVQEAKGLLDKGKDGASAGCGGGFRAPEDKLYALAEEPPAKKAALAPTPPPGSVINSMLAEIFCPSGGGEDPEEWHAQVVEELSNFKSQKVLGLNEDPLKWWSDRLALFPVLPKVLQKYWCVAATRVCPQRLFGSSANVVSAKRNRLAPAHVDEQVFLYENARWGAGAGAEAEPEDEDEGEWGLEQEQAFPLGDAAPAGFFGVRDGGFPGRVAIVTGGTSGIGFATARHLARLGMHVIIGERARRAGTQTEASPARVSSCPALCARVEFLYCDLASMKSIRRFARKFKEKRLPLHVLVNNAGVMMVPQRKTADGLEEHFGLNYLGHFLLTNLLLDTLRASGAPGRSARVVSVSSATHYVGELDLEDLQGSRGYSSHGAYAQSKLALVFFSYHLQRLLQAQGSHVTANVADPGVVDTELYKHVFWGRSILKKLLTWWGFKLFMWFPLWVLCLFGDAFPRPGAGRVTQLFCVHLPGVGIGGPSLDTQKLTPEEGAWTSVYTAVSPALEGVGGRYLYNEKETRSLQTTYDPELQRQLWARSCQMAGVRDVTKDLLSASASAPAHTSVEASVVIAAGLGAVPSLPQETQELESPGHRGSVPGDPPPECPTSATVIKACTRERDVRALALAAERAWAGTSRSESFHGASTTCGPADSEGLGSFVLTSTHCPAQLALARGPTGRPKPQRLSDPPPTACTPLRPMTRTTPRPRLQPQLRH
ncbi:Zinc finger BED domain-containing protein 1, partial [Galemys pyrenaicus]